MHPCGTVNPRRQWPQLPSAAGQQELTCEQQLVVHRDLAQLTQELAVEVLQAMALVHHHILPLVPLQQLAVGYHNLV